MAKFTPGSNRRNTDDSEGKIVVTVIRVQTGHKPVKGNIVRSITVANSTVSKVAEAVRQALFN